MNFWEVVRNVLSCTSHFSYIQFHICMVVTRPLHGPKKYGPARIHDCNEIPTVTPMFPGSDSRYRLLGILSYVWVYRQSKMAAINWKYIGHYVYLRSQGEATRIEYWEYGKHRLAVEMLLLTYIRAELWTIYHVVLVNGRHLLFPASPGIGQYSQ